MDPNQKKKGAVGAGAKSSTKPKTQSKAIVPRQSGAVAQKKSSGPLAKPGPGDTVLYAPKGYHRREVKPAANYDVVSFAKAMNEDFGSKVKKLFDPEAEAAIDAQKTGIYIGWRCNDYKHDCQRVGKNSKCFCGHFLSEHNKYNGHSVRVPCVQAGCVCKGFDFIPARPEDVGEFWFQRRRNFDPSTWRCKCRCKHTHEEHDPNGLRRCKARGCGCSVFDSASVCAACDRHTQKHETFFETAEIRKQNGFPVGENYLPFAEIPTLRNMALTGEESDESQYLRLVEGEGSIPERKAITGNDAPVQGYGASSGFRPVYD
ncbi:protein FAM221B-like [Tubulanus polymorphus]|uniref:protein FAM221B-like n=1 Tax=Tubulanus polymorphus TaxID=672921 RepID=UPI003DA28A11